VVVNSDDAHRQVSVFETVTTSRRPLKIFRELHAAHRWLATQSVSPASLLGDGVDAASATDVRAE